MARKRKTKGRGKIQLSRYFQKMVPGESVAVVKTISLASNFPKRIKGKTGIVESKRGKAYVVKIRDLNKEKRFIIEPIHLRKIQISS